MLAILSDIHGNLEALDAVLRDVAAMNAESIVCLGDLVGYGPDPCACIEIAMNWQIALRGYFDDALVHAGRYVYCPEHFLQMMQRLHQHITQHRNGPMMLEFLRGCPTSYTTGHTLIVHGSPRDHLHEYVFPEDIYNHKKMSSIFAGFDKLCFCGHSHIPGVFSATDRSEWSFSEPTECDGVFTIAGQKLLCNVGSVGQPRDGDPRACYVLFDGATIVFRRIDYDYQTTMDKIRSGDDDDMHGDRLPLGR